MKKIISFLLLAAMVVGCMVPAVITSASAGTLSVATIDKMEGTGAQVSPELVITGNPGVSAITFVLSYEKAVFAFDGEADPYDGALFSADDSSISNVAKSKLGNYIPEGASTSDYEAKKFEVMTAFDEDAEINPDIAIDGIVAKLPLALVNPVVGESYTYTVVVESAVNADGEDVDIALDTIIGTVNYVADPLVGLYDEFTLFVAPENAEIAMGTETVSVDVRVDANPGIWSTRVYVVYPNELTLVGEDENAGVNGTLFANAAYNVGKVNLPLSDEAHLKNFKDIIAAEGLDKDSLQASTFVWLPDDPNLEVSANGVLCSLEFKLPANAKPGDSYEIKAYSGAGDTFWAGTEDDGKTPLFIDRDYAAFVASTLTIKCDHLNTEAQHLDPTCGVDGYDKVVCLDCGATIGDETVLPATGIHTPGVPVIVESTCVVNGTSTVSCTVCDQVLSADELGLAEHTPGDEATCTTAQNCTVCGTELNPALGHVEAAPVVTNPTCTEDGLSVVNCDRCGVELSRIVLDATGHTYLNGANTVITAPTCTTDGYTVKTCDVCEDKWTTDIVPAWGHEADEAVVVEATYYADGSSTVSCGTCGEVLSSEVLPRLTINVTVNFENEAGDVLDTTVGDVYIDDAYLYFTALDAVVPGYTLVLPEGAELVEGEGELEGYLLYALALEEAATAEFTFTMTANTDIVYTVVYVDAEGNKLADDKVVEGQTMAAEVTEAAIAIEGYTADIAEQKLVLEATDNVITFTYTKDEVKEENKDEDKEDNKNDNSVQTGDNVMFIVIALAVVIVASVAVIIIRRKRSAN
ncbi:MAG: hypothetical protein E7575_04095 [Ruminococcaceae bacterium]|nr:hypothetical protein [Oscillospiraceae bacterium]